MFERVRNRNEKIDDSKAAEYLAYNKFFGQRPIKDAKVKRIINLMKEDMFLDGDIAFANCCYNGGETVLVNGQHTLTAVVETGIDIIARVRTFNCYSPDDLAMLYNQFDSEQMRSMQDRVRVTTKSLNLDWSAKISSIVVSAIAYIRGKQNAPGNERVELLKEHIAEGAWVNSILSNNAADSGFMFRIPVVIAMILSWKQNREAANEFWTSVKDGENLKKSMPAYVLRSWLIRTNIKTYSIKSQNMRVSGKDSAGRTETLAKCVVAWNAFRKGETTALKYYADKPIPKAI